MSPVPETEKYTIVLSSWLFKRSKSHSWQKKWCVLRRNQLAYYKDTKEYKASKVIPLEDILSFSEIPDGHKWHFILVTSQRVFHLRAPDAGTYTKWVCSMEKVLEERETPHVEEGAYKDEDDAVPEDEEENDEDDDEEEAGEAGEEEEEEEEFAPPQPISQADRLHQDFQHLHFSGTDDNFTTSENEGMKAPFANNNSTVSLQHFKERELPTPIPEESEADLETNHGGAGASDANDTSTAEHTPQRTVYFNSFSSSSPEHVIDTGYLYRLKKRYNQWKKYYITLTNHYLYFYKNSRDLNAGKEYKKIDLDEIIDCVELDPLSRSRVFCMLIVTPMKRIRFCADSEEELTKWLVLLKTIVKTRKNEKST